MSDDKTTVFRAQDVNHARRVCHTKAELSRALEWLRELEDQDRVLASSIRTSRHAPDVVEATWIADLRFG